MNIPYKRKNLLNTCRQAFIALAVFLSLAFCLDVPESYSVEASESYVFERMWPTLPQPWYFNRPRDVAVDHNGYVYVLDTVNHCIQKFNSDGNFITKWGSEGSGDGQFYWPSGISIDSQGFVYVADTFNNRIQKFDSDGKFEIKWGSEGSGKGQFSNPYGIMVDSQGFVYIADINNHRIQKFDSDGVFKIEWGSEGSGAGQFDWQTGFFKTSGISVDSQDHVYVVDSANDRIQKFDSDGNFITEWGSEGSGDGQFSAPSGISVDSQGFVYVLDTWNARIQKFDLDGKFITKWGSEGNGDKQFEYSNISGPRGISVDSQGLVYVADTLNDRIQKFDSDGKFITKWTSKGSSKGQLNYPSGILVDSQGFVYVADSHNHRIQKFDSDGVFKTEWGSEGSGNGQFSSPNGIAVDSDGNVYVADTGNYRIQKFDSDGVFKNKWGSEGSGNGQFDVPTSISVDSQGLVYVLDSWNNRIQMFDSDGNFITKWGSKGSGDGQFGQPYGISVDSQGFVYVADTYNYRIQKFDSDGNFKDKWGSFGSSDGQFGSSLMIGLGGISVDSQGFVYVADSGNYRIQKFDSDGNFKDKWGGIGRDAGQLNIHRDISVGPDGRIYVADTENHRIQVFKNVTKLSNNKAIVVAGGGPFSGNNLWDTTQMLANYAYKTLTFQGYTKDTIYYISADTDLDLDGNGILDDVDADATNANLEDAITAWALDASDVVVYLVNHGGNGTLRMSETEIMSAAELDSWLDILQGSITGRLTVVYEACESGSFMEVLAPSSGQDRILITSTSPDENAYFVSNGTISFSSFFWNHVFGGTNVYDAFTLSSNAISFSVEGQTPLLDDNGNGIGNEKEDGLVAINYFIGNGTEMGGDIPFIGSVSPEQDLNGETTALIWADGIVTTGAIERVWAVIIRPDSIPDSPDIPITDLPLLDLKDAGGGRYEGTYDNFFLYGTYDINIYAKDTNGNISLPKSTSIFQQDGTSTGTDPIPDIKANGTDGPLTMSQGFNLSVTVSISPGTHSGEDADWWVYATTSFGTYWYTLDSGWQPSSTPKRVYGGPLFSLPPYTILEMSTLPIGDYVFSFGIDTNMDGNLDMNQIYIDSVTVNVQ